MKTGNMHYLEFGTGETLVLLPSLWLMSRSYTWIGENLVSKYRVIIPDLFRGTSTFPTNASSITDYVNELHAFLMQLEIKQCYLVGISFSGLLAVNFAQQYPATVKKLLLVSTAVVVPQGVNNKLARLCMGYARMLYHNQFSKEGRQTNWQWITDGFLNLIQHPKQVILDGMIATGSDYGAHFSPKKMHVPTKLLFARKDEFISYDSVEHMRKIGNLTIEIINDYHPWFFLHKEQFVKQLQEFFQ